MNSKSDFLFFMAIYLAIPLGCLIMFACGVHAADSNPAYLQKPSPSPDLDNDGDVDMDDFGIFQRCASGASIPWDKKCMGVVR